MLIPDKIADQGTSYPFLIRQGSPYLGNSGKPLSVMNLNEEGNNLMQNPCSSASSSSSLGNFNLNKKTADEVWGEIVNQECVNAVVNRPLSNKRQLTIGETTTVEEFLGRADFPNLGDNNDNQGNPVINRQTLSVIDPVILEKQQTDWMKFQMEPCSGADQQHRRRPPQKRNFEATIDGRLVESQYRVSDIGQVFDAAGYLDNRVELPIPLQKVEATSSESHLGGERKRHFFANEMMEKSMERRQRRMIKNRESAAKSRAKKQVYT